MRAILKGLIYILGILMLILILGVAGIIISINPNNYKDKIVSQVQQQTNRSFAINGGLHWSVFPSLGIKAENVVLGNPPSFSQDSPFLTAKSASLDIATKPLWEGELRVGALILDGVNLNLIKNKNGEANWKNIIKPSPGSSTQQAESPSSATNNLTNRFKISAASISKITIKDTNISLDDETSNQHLKFNDVNLESSDIDINKAFPVDIKLSYISQDFPNPIPLQLKTMLQIDPNTPSIILDQLSGAIANMKFSGSISANAANQPNIQGNLMVSTFNPKQLLQTLGKNADSAPTSVQAQFNFNATPDTLSLTQLKATVDGSNMQGNITLSGSNNVTFNLNVDQLNASKSADQKKTVALNELSPISNANALSQSSGVLPAGIKKLNAKGNLNIGNLILKQTTAKNVALSINAKNGLIQIPSFTSQIYGGNLKGNLTINAQSSSPQWHVVSNFSGVNVGDLLKSTEKVSHIQLSGQGNVAANLNTVGNDIQTLKQNLNGSANITVNNGVLQGIDLSYYSDLADALTNQTQPTSVNTGKTPFGNLTSSWQINQGIASNKDLAMSAPKMKITGNGTANLVNETINYQLLLQRLTSGSKIENRGDPIPILISGSFSNVKIQPDWKTLTINQAKTQLSKQLEKHSDQIDKALGNSELSKSVQQGLKSLLGG